MSKFTVCLEEFDLEPSYPGLSPEIMYLLDRPVKSFSVVNGAPATGKTTLAIMYALRYSQEGKKCLYIAVSSFLSKYVSHFFRKNGINGAFCMTYREFDRNPHNVDLILLDDSEHYTLEQINGLRTWSKSLMLFGNYNKVSPYGVNKAIMSQILSVAPCDLYSLSLQWFASKLNPVLPTTTGAVHFSCRPIISQIPSIEGQCEKVVEKLDKMALQDVAILCYTRKLVKTVFELLNKYGLDVEVYLPGKEDGADTIDLDSANPKLLTIASSVGLHFNTVFVLGYDKDVIWKDPERVIASIASIARENLFIFYQNQLPDLMAKFLAEDAVRDSHPLELCGY